MPYCPQCGTQVGSADKFCAACGGIQPNSQTTTGFQTAGSGQTPPPPPSSDPLQGISGHTASLLCYIPLLGWIAAIVVLASDRFRQDLKVRFHAFQGLYLFAAWMLAEWVVSPLLSAIMFGSGGGLVHLLRSVLHAAVFVGWIVMLVKLSQNQDYRLPIIGELAEKSVQEQRL